MDTTDELVGEAGDLAADDPALAGPESTLPLAVLDFVGIEYGESAAAALAGAVGVAQALEAAGYRRYWVSEHHNMKTLACSAPELLIAHVGAFTDRIRVGAAGIMLPNHAALKVAETFRTLLAMYPGRIDLALGRAPGTDPLTAHVLRRGMVADPAAEFPAQVGELLAFLGDGFPEGHPYRQRFQPRRDGDQPYSAMSVLAFASNDPDAVADFEAAWTLTRRNIQRGVREPLAPETVREFRESDEFRLGRRRDGRMVLGEPKAVVERLMEMKSLAEVDEIVVVTPSLDRGRRKASFTAIADAWRQAS
jgi:alkanesulfonate monooxygenase SsuD/methylene tetrahydromethanopterin reductase-like flavin-dependent oxidoreductase (luciferase family)